jgi:hypothetical protein
VFVPLPQVLNANSTGRKCKNAEGEQGRAMAAAEAAAAEGRAGAETVGEWRLEG